MSTPINRWHRQQSELPTRTQSSSPTTSAEVDDAARRNDFGHAPQVDSQLDQDEVQVRLRVQRQMARRALQHSGQRQGDSQAEGVQGELPSEDDSEAVSAAAQAGNAGEQEHRGSSHDEGRQERGQIAWQAARRRFEQSMASLPQDAADRLRTLAVNLRCLPDQHAAPLLAAALAQCMVTMVNSGESERVQRGALAQTLEQLALRRLLRESRLKLRTSLPGAKAALIGADVIPRAAWERSEDGDDARLLLPLLYMDACRRHNLDNGFAED